MRTSEDLLRARELIARCLNGVTTDAEAAELSRLLIRDPAVAAEFAHASSQESDLEILYGPESEEPLSVRIPAYATSPSRGMLRRVSIAAGAAAIAAAVLLIVWSWRGETGNRPTAVVSGYTRDTASRIIFADGSTAELSGEGSSLQKQSETAAGTDVALTKGAARFDVVPRAGRRFRVWVGALHVDVMGTIFTVERLPSTARVAVEQGSVKVISGVDEFDIPAGSARLVPFSEPPARAAAPRNGSPSALTATPRPVARRDEPGALLSASDAAREAGRPEEARDLLERILDQHPRDPRAPYAAFILGRVLLDELGRPREAAAAFARVTVLDPRTPLGEDALAREVESWFQAGDGSRVHDRAKEYLSRYPDGRRKDQVRRYSRLE